MSTSTQETARPGAENNPPAKPGRTGKPPAWLRIGIPIVLILVWLAGAGIGGPYFGKVGEVASNDRASFLPASSDATLVGERFTDFVGEESIPAIVIFTAESAIDGPTLAELGAIVEGLAELESVESVSPLIPSDDGLAAQAFIPLDAQGELGDSVAEVRASIAEQVPDGITHNVTGPAGFSADLGEAFGGIDGLLLAVALGAVLVILLVVYRSLLLPFLVLFTSLFALCVALLVNWWLAKWEVLSLNGQTQGILFILVIGAATDYALLYTARYSEELRRNASRFEATVKTLKGSLEPILASGGTVIAGLLCLLFSDLASNKSLGPVAAIGIVFAMLSALTLLPAMLLLLGRAAFWPRRPKYDPDRDSETWVNRGLYAATGRFIAKRPRIVWIVCVVLLAVGAAFAPTLKADGVATSDLVLGASDARDGQEAVAEHFPGGSGDPANILTREADLQEVSNILLGIDGVESVTVLAQDSPSGSAPVTSEGIQPLGPPGTPAPEPTVNDGDVMLQATLAYPGDSIEAEEVVRDIRDQLDGTALVGGTTAVSIDTNETSIRDRNLIIPIVLVVILVILMALLRSVLAPVLLVATTVLSFGTAMGTAALVFNHLLGLPGADPSVPLYGFVFLVALGIDYNIFLMTRVREESLQHGTRAGILRGLAVTGGVITSAGIVLAATFAALAVIPILFLLQLAFIVAFGVLLDTFFVRTLLVPALGLDIGPRLWWPSRLAADAPEPRHAESEPVASR
ncbi:MMPL family transporter [Tessaracoccus sp. OS52]|uniref:MMPL family transporter n=1 Tax=Tessaracoccus sp. OS52 TaxID=2886691 RepID=UPI001D113021|nr:efflux RND transporter permease subunit [Tessaracoccus sp. OS52]MCC2594090.1 MMPL family transporter [Tessaracoccus sp. OS52]